MTQYAMREHKLAHDVKAVLGDIEELLAAVSADSKEGVSAVQPRVEAGIREARSRLAEMDAALSARVHHAANQADAYVHRHPWEIAAVAAAAGAAVGALIGVLIAGGPRRE